VLAPTGGLGYLTAGDLVFLYIAQHGSFDTTTTMNSDYGQPLSSSLAGTYQVNRVLSRVMSGGLLVYLECDADPAFIGIGPNSNNYYGMTMTKVYTAQTFQIGNSAKVVAYSYVSLISAVNPGGGVVPIIANLITMAAGASISADSSGFSGGIAAIGTAPCGNCTPVDCAQYAYLQPTTTYSGGQKGVSIAPYSEDPTVRQYCRGALANGGGGGNSYLASGGGGANICDNSGIYDWTGDGVRPFCSPSFLLGRY